MLAESIMHLIIKEVEGTCNMLQEDGDCPYTNDSADIICPFRTKAICAYNRNAQSKFKEKLDAIVIENKVLDAPTHSSNPSNTHKLTTLTYVDDDSSTLYTPIVFNNIKDIILDEYGNIIDDTVPTNVGTNPTNVGTTPTNAQNKVDKPQVSNVKKTSTQKRREWYKKNVLERRYKKRNKGKK